MKNNKISLSLKKAIKLPLWIKKEIRNIQNKKYPTMESKMAVAIELSRLNIVNKTGGPFGCAIFDARTNRVISVGVNRVVPENCSVAHGEIVAIMLAQDKAGFFDLSKLDACLVTSAQPCAMCCGAIVWSGVREIIYGATKKDVEQITGFDEGQINRNWIKEVNKRGITVVSSILRKEAIDVLYMYTQTKGILYNPESNKLPKARISAIVN